MIHEAFTLLLPILQYSAPLFAKILGHKDDSPAKNMAIDLLANAFGKSAKDDDLHSISQAVLNDSDNAKKLAELEQKYSQLLQIHAEPKTHSDENINITLNINHQK